MPHLPLVCLLAAASYWLLSLPKTWPYLGSSYLPTCWIWPTCLSQALGTTCDLAQQSDLLCAQCLPAWIPWLLWTHPVLLFLAVCPAWKSFCAVFGIIEIFLILQGLTRKLPHFWTLICLPGQRPLGIFPSSCWFYLVLTTFYLKWLPLGFEAWLCHFLALLLWASYSCSLTLNFLTCKMGRVILFY